MRQIECVGYSEHDLVGSTGILSEMFRSVCEGSLGSSQWQMVLLKAATSQYIAKMKSTSTAESVVFNKLSSVCRPWRDAIIDNQRRLRRLFNRQFA